MLSYIWAVLFLSLCGFLATEWDCTEWNCGVIAHVCSHIAENVTQRSCFDPTHSAAPISPAQIRGVETPRSDTQCSCRRGQDRNAAPALGALRVPPVACGKYHTQQPPYIFYILFEIFLVHIVSTTQIYGGKI